VTVAEDSAAALRSWAPIREADRRLQQEYVDFADDPAHAHRETSTEQHLTASAFVFDAAFEQVLLCFHGKGRFWVQFGGHIEQSDASLAGAALREAREESGLSGLTPLLTTPVDLDRHALSSGFGTCRVHWDVGFAFIADPTAAAVASEESESVAWWPIGALPDGSVPGLDGRIARAVETVRGISAP
jgi:ADP-ribose pyrophosphatase YjhB (NUDIX family)